MHGQDPTTDVTQTFLDRGVLGALVVVLLAVTWWFMRREAARTDEAQRQLTELHETIRTDVLAALIKATEASATLAKVAELLPDVVSALRDHDRGRR